MRGTEVIILENEWKTVSTATQTDHVFTTAQHYLVGLTLGEIDYGLIEKRKGSFFVSFRSRVPFDATLAR